MKRPIRTHGLLIKKKGAIIVKWLIWTLTVLVLAVVCVVMVGCDSNPSTTPVQFTAKAVNTDKKVSTAQTTSAVAEQAVATPSFERTAKNANAVKTVWSETGVMGKTEKVVYLNSDEAYSSITIVEFEDGDMVILTKNYLVAVPVGRLVSIKGRANLISAQNRAIDDENVLVKLLD